MESTQTYLFFSPSSVLVALVTLAFLIHRAWPRFVQPGQSDKLPLSTSNPTIDSDLAVSKEPELPEGWWSSREFFELERRGLFSQTWIYLAHTAQFKKPGAYQSFDLAGFPVFLIRGKDDKIRAFHNVCRHRAYTITRKETGASTVLGCRYHGWSYDTTGRLVKAPQFDDVPGFDKSQNSLFEVHTHTTDYGMVLVNLKAEEPADLGEEQLSSLNNFARKSAPRKNLSWVAGRTVPGDFNWKMATKPLYLDLFTRELESQAPRIFGPSPIKKVIRRIMGSNPVDDSSFFPATFFYQFVDTELWFALSFLPATETKTQIRYDIFSRSPVSEIAAEPISKTFENVSNSLIGQIEQQYRQICKAQSIPIEFIGQNTHQILRRVQDHRRLERLQGTQVIPAMHKPKGSNLFQQAEKLCKELDCVSGGAQSGTSPGVLDW
ncbi:Aromatic-ring-hydroxylating dioxygenase alpha subunit [Penicillium brevicompactum]|uniref:Aromatic-ring-hydroxylating dioxygenase alpha subunit n=1 Tax=Penicillium brevicompactum TaxID=5074 RepID=A0A9W9UR28_PENBR|nr:Aromatic-ring-hydroxylating dioxygenase alpha subunit [Penicillium brevicompactum]